MKTVLWVLVSVVIVAFGIAYFVSPTLASSVNQHLSYSACDKPISYRLGNIDARFNLTPEEVLSSVKKASTPWSTAEGKELFTYDQDKGDLTISMVYDERQSLTSQISNLHEQIDTEKNSINPKIQEYEQKVANFKKRVAALNEQIAYWNSRGGAPADEYDKLSAEQQALKTEAGELNDMSQEVNRSTEEYNSQIGQLNNTIDTFNSAIKSRPEEGLYNGKDNTITIYFMSNSNELLHTLTHEFGHALGIEHVANPTAIMYYQTNDQLALTSDDTKALASACRERTIFDIAGERVTILGERIVNLFQHYKLIP